MSVLLLWRTSKTKWLSWSSALMLRAERNCSRRYRLEAGTDLLGVWVVQTSYGRIGTAGRSRSYVLPNEAEAQRLVQRILKHQARAPRRIGVVYRIRELIDDRGWAGAYGAIEPTGEATGLD
jgi:predicted DNA-binding WGR domain protein